MFSYRAKSTWLMLMMIVVVVPAASASGSQQRSSGATERPQSERLREAQIAAGRLVRRFHETLDFGDIFAAEFVTAPELRRLAVKLDNRVNPSSFDARSERAYVALMNYVLLLEAFVLSQYNHVEPPELKDPGVLRLIGRAYEAETDVEFNQQIAEIDKVCNLYRRIIPRNAFRRPGYWHQIRRQRERERTYFEKIPRVENGYPRFGIPEGVPVYVVRPEVFDYYFVEEKGSLKLFRIDFIGKIQLFQ